MIAGLRRGRSREIQGQLIVRVARLDELEAVVSIPESRIDADRNAAATVTLWADADRAYAAKLREISPQADPATRTYQARYSLIKPDAAIALGKTATVHLASPGAGERAKLPLAAVFKDQGQPSVWLIDEALKKDKGNLVSFMIYPGEFHYFTRTHILKDAWHRVDDFFDFHLRDITSAGR